jgi:hypothetical protein
MSIIPCQENHALREKIEQYAELLRTQAHLVGEHGFVRCVYGLRAERRTFCLS